jgi:hypothetical protein
MDVKKIFNQYPWLQEVAFVLLFGLLSALMGLVEFKIPGLRGTATDLREIPILISVIYLRRFVSIIGIIVISSLSLPANGVFVSYFIMHLSAGIFFWVAYAKLKTYNFNHLQAAIVWSICTLIYYAIIIPAYVVTEIVLINNPLPLIASVLTMVAAVKFEVITTALVSSLYLIKHNIRNQLRENQANLEQIIYQRTLELTDSNQQLLVMNEELISTAEEVRALNDNLEKIVQTRTEKINEQLHLLEKYVHMNSHEVRGPLARILGLISLIKMDKENTTQPALIEKLNQASEELDLMVRKMNRLLETELPDDTSQSTKD